MAEKEETERTAMMWPVDVKAAVRDRVGPRGLTDFTIAAVKEKLGQPVPDAELAESKELGDARFLVQRLADCVAMSGEYEDRESVLREIDLPPWVQTIGWPENLARAINPIEPVGVPVRADKQVSEPVEADPVDAAPVDEQEPIDHPYEAGYSGFACVRMVFRDGSGEDCGAPAAAHVGVVEQEPPGVGDNVVTEPPRAHSNDLFRRLTEKAKEKGVDISGADLVPASQIERPEVKTLTAEEVGWDLKVEPEPEAREPHIESMDNHANHRLTGQDCTDACPVEGNAHNHSWNKFEDVDGLYVGQPYFCACGATMDKERVYERDEVPARPLPEVQVPTEVAVPLEVPPDEPTPVPSWQQRAGQMEVDF